MKINFADCLVVGIIMCFFVSATSLNFYHCEPQKQIFAGSLAVHTGFNGVATIQSLPVLFPTSPKISDK